MQVLVLGPLEVVGDDGRTIPLSGARIRTLTALLALDAGHVVSTDRLIDCLYGDQLPQGAANALQLQVSRLRRALRASGGADTVLTRPPGYVLDLGPEQVDALAAAGLIAEGRACLEAGDPAEGSALLRQALALWRGDALADFAYDDFATGERARLTELRLSVLEDCIDADLALGRHAECVQQLESLVAAHPLREGLWCHLMLALYRCGRQAEALRAFQDARRQLGEELGIEPGPALRRMEEAILAQDPALAGTSRPLRVVAPAGNLVRPLTGCIGRRRELSEVHDLLVASRLVTLIGPGGTGKTRLAVEAGLTRADHVPGSVVWVVDLASVPEGQGVLPAVRAALGLQAPALGSLTDGPNAAGLAAAIGDRDALIVLDNCEHVVADAAVAAADLVASCPQLRVLATSRECLGVPGEALYAVPPLAQDAAAQLFLERARSSAPGVAFDDDAILAVADICRRLDGLPLAIELAAARVRALDVSQIAARLHDRFRLLAAGPRTLVPRQRTLRAVVDWSYDLLDADERILFERLSVFASAASLDAVETVCAGDGIDVDDVALVLSRLVDKSLVVVVPGPNGNRYAMLQTLSQYGAEKLAAGENGSDVVRRRHAGWILALARAAERGAGHLPTVSLVELDAEVDDLDAALAWARGADPALAFELATRLGWFWFWTGRIDSGWQALSAGLAQAPDVAGDLRARATAWGGMLATVMQDDAAPALVEAAVELARRAGDDASLGQALVIRGGLTVLRGDAAQALGDLDEAGAHYSAAGDLHGQGIVSMLQGLAAAAQGRTDDARTRYERSASQLTAGGDGWAAGVSRQRLAELDADDAGPSVPTSFSHALIRAQLGRGGPSTDAAADALALAVADHIRGRVSFRQNRPEEARADLELALHRYRTQGHAAAVSSCLGDMGRIAAALGDGPRAVRLHAEATVAAVGTSDGRVVLSALEGLSAALVAAGDCRRAGLALGAADVLREAGARPWDATLDDDRAPVEAALAAQLGATVLHDVRAQGRGIALRDLLDQLVA